MNTLFRCPSLVLVVLYLVSEVPRLTRKRNQFQRNKVRIDAERQRKQEAQQLIWKATMSDVGIKDGEYEVDLSSLLRTQLSEGVGSQRRHNEKIFSIRYGFRPDSMDETEPLELSRESETSFKLKSHSTEHDRGMMFEGSITEPKELECILLFNSGTSRFDLVQLDSQLRANLVRNGSSVTNKNNTEEKHRQIKKSTDNSSTSSSVSPLSSGITISSNSSYKNSDIDIPLAKLGSHKSRVLTNSISERKPASNTPTISKTSFPASKRTTSKREKIVVNEEPSNGTANKKPRSLTKRKVNSSDSPSALTSKSQNGSVIAHSSSIANKPLPKQVASKKPPSTISTPTLVSNPESEEDDEFNSLADELEEELLSDDNLITVEGDKREKHEHKTMGLDVPKSGSQAPINFRNLAGASRNDEDDISSSEEE